MQSRKPARRATRFSELSPARQRLLRLCQRINYGSLRGLEVRGREPIFDPSPDLVLDVKLDGEHLVRPEIDLRDFVLRDEVVQLMDHLDRLITGTIESLEVQAGNPRRVIFLLPPEHRTGFLGLSAEKR